MKYVLYIAAIIVLLGVQIGLFDTLKVSGVAPNLLLLFVVGCSLQREAEDSFFVALVSGLFLDFFHGLFVGSFALAFMLLTLGLYVVIHRLVVFELSWKYLLTVVVAATVLVTACVWLVQFTAAKSGLTPVSLDFSLLRSTIVLQILYNLLLSYPVYFLATWLKNTILSLQGKKHRIL